jgi:membrane protease YdiL (CAAX protease family)
MRPSKFRAVGLAAALVGWSFAAPRVRWHPIPNASLGTALVAITRSPLGLRPPALWSGLRYGLAAGAAAALGVAAITSLPHVQRAMAQRDLPEHPARWLLLSIPIGTVWPEEAAYRATLGALAEDVFGPTCGRLLQAAAFGLWHIVDARITGQPVIGTVLATGVAGWFFGWLHARSGSLAAPMLAHLAVNEAAGLATLAVQSRAGG